MKIHKAPLITGVRRISHHANHDFSINSAEEIDGRGKNTQSHELIVSELTPLIANYAEVQDSVPAAIADDNLIHDHTYLNDQMEKLKSENCNLKNELDTLQIRDKENVAIEFDRARNEGFKTGQELAQNHMSEISSRLEKLLEAIDKNITSSILNTKSIVTEAVFSSLCRILGASYSNEILIVNIITSVLKDVRETVNIKILISDADLRFINANIDNIPMLNFPSIKLIADPKIRSGGCMIETDNGVWDARLETQLQKFKESFIADAKR